jgi:hypothetical protein
VEGIGGSLINTATLLKRRRAVACDTVSTNLRLPREDGERSARHWQDRELPVARKQKSETIAQVQSRLT